MRIASEGEVKRTVKVFLRGMQIVFAFAFVLAVLFVPAGTLAWPEAWLLVSLYSLSVAGVALWMRRKDEGLLRERTDRKREGKTWDKILLSVYSVFLLCMLVTCGLDAVRFGWTKLPPAVEAVGFLLLVPAGVIVFLAMRENTFLSEVVRIQEDRGHHVIKTGPYAIVRHPMYTGIILFVVAIPLALGSLSGLVFSAAIAIVFVVRTLLEEATLRAELPGYADYANEVRYRLVPGLW